MPNLSYTEKGLKTLRANVVLPLLKCDRQGRDGYDSRGVGLDAGDTPPADCLTLSLVEVRPETEHGRGGGTERWVSKEALGVKVKAALILSAVVRPGGSHPNPTANFAGIGRG